MSAPDLCPGCGLGVNPRGAVVLDDEGAWHPGCSDARMQAQEEILHALVGSTTREADGAPSGAAAPPFGGVKAPGGRPYPKHQARRVDCFVWLGERMPDPIAAELANLITDARWSIDTKLGALSMHCQIGKRPFLLTDAELWECIRLFGGEAHQLAR